MKNSKTSSKKVLEVFKAEVQGLWVGYTKSLDPPQVFGKNLKHVNIFREKEASLYHILKG